MAEAYDLIVIGGGPAGSAAAIIAAENGCRVLLLEAATFPRHHVGESLVNLWEEFSLLGVLETMDATFQHKYGSRRIWGRDHELHPSKFTYVAGRRKYSLQVERSLFDQILLQRAEAVGATVRQGHRVTAVCWEGERAVGVRYRDPAGREHEARSAWVVDASGREGLIAKQRRLRAVDPFYPDLSIYGYYTGATRFPDEAAGDLLIEAVPAGWFWYIPLHDGTVSVGLVCDRSSRDELRRKGAERFLGDAVAGSGVVRDMLAEAALTVAPYVTASYGYRSRRYAGPGWLLAGDAGSFVDPMWATGVAHALLDGIVAGAMVEAATSGRAGEAEIVARFSDLVEGRTEKMHDIVKFVYRCNHLYAGEPFWRARREGDEEDPAATVRLLRYMAKDPSASYYRITFQGMGVDAETTSLLEQTARRGGEDVEHLAQDLGAWVPCLAPGVRLRRTLGLQGSRMVTGLEIDNSGVDFFLTDTASITALEAVDGRRTAQEVIGLALQAAPVQERFRAGLLLPNALIAGYQQGVFDIVASETESETRGRASHELAESRP